MQTTVKTVAGSVQKVVDSTLQWGDMMHQRQLKEAVQTNEDTVDVKKDDADCIEKINKSLDVIFISIKKTSNGMLVTFLLLFLC